ncbi:MAG: FlgD immunoglobulin-like domain containing protein [Candidatus Margulisiibacteriota bacterium]
MKRRLLIGIILLLAVAGASAYNRYMPVYFLSGFVKGVRPGVDTTVYFYRDAAALQGTEPQYTLGLIDGSGNYVINGFGLNQTFLAVGQKHFAATAQVDGQGGGPVEFTVTGSGYDLLPEMEIKAGGGIIPPGALNEPAPKLQIWFGRRLYQPAILAAGGKFVISDQPEIRADVTIETPYGLSGSVADYSIVVDPGSTAARVLALNDSHMTLKTAAAGSALKSFTLQYTVSEAEKLASGEHVFAFAARSSGALGAAASVTELASVEVAGGPLRVIGAPLTFPAPVRLRDADKKVTIQYTLSGDADIDIYIYSVEGKIVKKINCAKLSEGGSAGTNKVVWDTVAQDGRQAGAGVYAGSILARFENRVLAKVKIAIIE